MSDIGKKYQGVLFTSDEYMATENKYIATAKEIIRLFGVTKMKLEGLEDYVDTDSLSSEERSWYDTVIDSKSRSYSIDEVGCILRLCLREILWCNMVGSRGTYINVGHDYYVHVACKDLSDIDYSPMPDIYIEFEEPREFEY